MTVKSGFNEELEKEVKSRVDAISTPDYQFAPSVNKQDYLCIVGFMIFCVAALVYGVM